MFLIKKIMEDLYTTYTATHNGLSYSVIILFGTFIFMSINTLIAYSGRVSEVLRKSAFFTMLLLYMQAILGFMMGFSSPEFQGVEGVGALFQYFRYALSILLVAGMITVAFLYLKKNPVMPLKILILILVSALFFESVFPWKKVFGF